MTDVQLHFVPHGEVHLAQARIRSCFQEQGVEMKVQFMELGRRRTGTAFRAAGGSGSTSYSFQVVIRSLRLDYPRRLRHGIQGSFLMREQAQDVLQNLPRGAAIAKGMA
jgi:hypothetical protein